jgi:phosphoribosylamine---glycine ligase
MNKEYKVLVVGNGGREHAFTWKLSQSKHVKSIFVAPGNAGTEREGKTRNIDIDSSDINSLLNFAKKENIDLTIVGPENPLVKGIVDLFTEHGVKCFGPSSDAAQLEGSKSYAKDFMKKYSIPTAEYEVFTNHDCAKKYLSNCSYPIVIKADGLAAGKGVTIEENISTALITIGSFMQDETFGSAGKTVVIEEFLVGEEASFIAIVDGHNILPLATSQDHKTIGEGDIGLNTGGMGAYSPAPIITEELHEYIMDKIMRPTVDGLIQEGFSYRGFLYAGLMINNDGVKVLEYNCRFGDPETQPIMMRLESDFIELLESSFDNTIADFPVSWKKESSLGVVMSSKGYPEKYKTGYEIKNIDTEKHSINTKIFHSGTTKYNGEIVTSGGRVLCVTSLGISIEAAKIKSYEAVSKINWDGCYYRKDIGDKAIE